MRLSSSFSCLADCSQLVLQNISYSSPVPERSSRESAAPPATAATHITAATGPGTVGLCSAPLDSVPLFPPARPPGDAPGRLWPASGRAWAHAAAPHAGLVAAAFDPAGGLLVAAATAAVGDVEPQRGGGGGGRRRRRRSGTAAADGGEGGGVGVWRLRAGPIGPGQGALGAGRSWHLKSAAAAAAAGR